ncbi:MAG: NAD-dependent epimerase/dehydratase family protein [Acidimicrobiia bacterium]|nr:NAD-dependent epimerase/dehydratase family protein [Acidimicrobiia bacterium]
MAVVLVTGAHGLVGGESVRFFSEKGFQVVGIDNDMRSFFFGSSASTAWQAALLRESCPSYLPVNTDIRDSAAIDRLFAEYASDIALVIHAAAQPSHDWAAQDPLTDFHVNATGTLNLLEATRKHCPQATFIFTSTNKVYGDRPNSLPLAELPTRWELDPSHPCWNGIDESMPVDQTTHSLFGCSKLAADILVQEYGRYFGMNTACFRAGCITGPAHSGAPLHGFLAYLMKCAATGIPYRVLGYGGKQVRDNIHSADLVNAFHHFHLAPRPSEVYNIGGGRFCNCSLLEAVSLCEEISGVPLDRSYAGENRIGDHIWWISDTSKFQSHYPGWKLRYGLREILMQIHSENHSRWMAGATG